MTPISATSAGGSSIAAGIRKTIVVWYDWFREGMRTTKSCAVAAIRARIVKVVQPGVDEPSRVIAGTAATAVAAPTKNR